MKNATQDLSPAMVNLLKSLKVQAEVSVEYPGAYTNFRHVGGPYGCNAHTAQALIARKLVDAREMPSGIKRISINAAGLAALPQPASEAA